MAIQEEMERALEGGDQGSALDTMRLMEQERSTVGEPVAAVAAREQQLRKRHPLQPWDAPQAATAPPEPVTEPRSEELKTEETEQVDVILPNGEEITVIVPRDMSDEDIEQRLKAMGELPPDPAGAEPESRRGAMFLQGATIGTGDELTAMAGAAVAKFSGAEEGYMEIYNDILESERYLNEKYREAKPGEALAWEAAGAVGTAVASGGSTAPLTTGRAVATGLGWGGLYGAGAADPDKDLSAVEQVQERAKQAAMTGAIGAVGGVAVQKGVKAIQQTALKRKFKTLEGTNKVAHSVEEGVMSKMVTGTPRLQAVRETLQEKGIPAKYARDIMINRSGVIGWGKTPEDAAEWLVANKLWKNGIRMQKLSKTMDEVLTPLVTRIEAISPELGTKLRQYEAKVSLDVHNWHEEAKGFLQGIKNIPKAEQRELSKALYNGKTDDAKAILGKYGLNEEYAKINSMLDRIKGQMSKRGAKFVDAGGGYFPRRITDIEGLKEALGSKYLTGFQAYAQRIDNPVNAINMFMRGERTTKGTTSLRSRKVREIDDDLIDYYHNPIASLDLFFREAAQFIHRRDFIGYKNLVTKKANIEQTEDSLKNLTKSLSRLTPEEQNEVMELLKVRFMLGDRNLTEAGRAVRTITHAALLSNPVSATTQLADVGVSAWVFGLRDTVPAFFKSVIPGKPGLKITADDLGIMRDMASEINESPLAMERIGDSLFKLSGFKSVDRLGKNTAITAAFNKSARMARSFHGRKQLVNDLTPLWGKETPQLIQDLKDGKPTELVKQYLFTQLSRMQPISKSEMPEKYLSMKNGRLFYQLSSWTIKQLDLMQREILDTYARGNKTKALKQLTSMFIMVGGANVTVEEMKRYMTGRQSQFAGEDVSAETVAAKMLGHTFKNFIGDEDPARAMDRLFNITMPSADLLYQVGKTGAEMAASDYDYWQEQEVHEKAAQKLVGYVPLLGKIVSNWLLGGAEAFNEKEQERKKKEYMERMKY